MSEKSFNVLDLYDRNLFIFGFIDSLLTFGFNSMDKVHITLKTGSELSPKVKVKGVIIVVDEFMSVRDSNVNY